MNFSSDFIVQTAPLWVKNAKIKCIPYSPLAVGPSNIIVEGVWFTTTTVSDKKCFGLINNVLLLDHYPVNLSVKSHRMSYYICIHFKR